jgi:hypothetical protein
MSEALIFVVTGGSIVQLQGHCIVLGRGRGRCLPCGNGLAGLVNAETKQEERNDVDSNRCNNEDTNGLLKASRPDSNGKAPSGGVSLMHDAAYMLHLSR